MGIPNNPDDHYPDVVAAGSLAAALLAIAAESGPTFPVILSEANPLGRATVPSTVPHRNAMAINGYTWKRNWYIRGEEAFQDMELIGGDTDDLAEIAKAARAWHDGATLTDIRETASFVHLSGRFEVADNDPAQLTASEWQHMRIEAGEADWPQYHELIEAAYAEPTLRVLYPFTSHWTLRFSTSTRPCLTPLPPCLAAPRREGRYTLNAHFMGDVITEATTADEAVTALLSHMPSGLGTVTFGAAPQND
ncbi:hypothetical protein GCM10009839_17780 [Catenulispora yoronensis]|uniref:Uncharacterized protein n=1 Tax=Catenulispora yoronensis TaxID=450799 RepID=A0ABN2TUM2_9ACTN